MYRLAVDDLRAGMVVGEDVLDDDGTVLLRAGARLTGTYIAGLRRHGRPGVQVRDGLADDVVVRDIISVPLRASATTHLATVFQGVVRAADAGEHDGGVEATVARLGEQALALDAATLSAVDRLFADVERLLSEVLDDDAVATLETLKTHNGYTYQHSVNVAAVGALLGARAGLSRPELRELVLGCLLHDIGKTYIDVAILDKPGRLTAEEFDEVKKHPRLGFELVRRLPLASILPAHVAYQHHERQDGAGYPRELVGHNRIPRDADDRYDPRRILLLAEVAAVADVYSALTADRPYRPALPHDVAADLMAGMAGAHLNREILGLLFATVPRYPLGHWVELTDGPLPGARGVVTAVHPERPDRPTVRLLLDAGGRPLGAPEEIDTRVAEGVRLRLVEGPVPLHGRRARTS